MAVISEASFASSTRLVGAGVKEGAKVAVGKAVGDGLVAGGKSVGTEATLSLQFRGSQVQIKGNSLLRRIQASCSSKPSPDSARTQLILSRHVKVSAIRSRIASLQVLGQPQSETVGTGIATEGVGAAGGGAGIPYVRGVIVGCCVVASGVGAGEVVGTGDSVGSIAQSDGGSTDNRQIVCWIQFS